MTQEKHLKIITPVCVLNFPSLFAPKPTKHEVTPKYRLSCWFTKESEEFNKKLIAEKRIKDGLTFEEFSKKIKDFANLHGCPNPLTKGDNERNEKYYGSGIVIGAKMWPKSQEGADQKPLIVDTNGNPITDPNQLYSGCLVKVVLVLSKSSQPNLGVKFSTVMKVAERTRLGATREPDTIDIIDYQPALTELAEGDLL